MWRDRLDAFWDGRRGFAILFCDDDESGAPTLRPDIIVLSAPDPEFAGATLLDRLDAWRLRGGHCVVELPPDHSHISLRAPDGAELRVALRGADAPSAGGEMRLLLVDAPETAGDEPASFRAVSAPARGDVERATRGTIARSGARLVWALRERRHVERRDGVAALLQLWAAQRVFPAQQSRIVLEALERQTVRGPPALKAPFAIMENWLRENGAPCPALRLRCPDAFDRDVSLLARTSVVLAMHQRRRLREWAREERAAGEPIIEPLDFADIRRAVGAADERPEAVESDQSIVVHNLVSILAAGDGAAFDGVSATRWAEEGERGLVLDLHFFGASLGDDIGVVGAAADACDLGVVPDDPGGAAFARLFRVESDGPRPRRVAEEDRLLDEILRLAADQERDAGLARAPAERGTSAQGRREGFVSGMNAALAAAAYPGRLHAARQWDMLEPISMAAFARLCAEADAEGRATVSRLGGYDAYRADPSLMEACVRAPQLARAADEARFRACCGGARALPPRFLALCRASGLMAATAGAAAQSRLLELLLAHPAVAARAMETRMELDDARDPKRVDEIAFLLRDEAMVERAAIYCDDLRLDAEARRLRDYVIRRRAGEWTPLAEAQRLAVVVDEANAYWRRLDMERAAPIETGARAVAAAPKSDGFLATMRNFLRFGGARGPGG
ncbi:hypothetical+protein [Methylocapsa aurea]|uniref:hypothetical protein n=1 Tax=Methylocapsa aurea TaxID=663610 RepID=UPI003D18F0B5